ncbi:MAG TPA: class II aldolase/adducin family protein [Ramlibacter sp.]|nr:class II aldolase/adducin family protein [Ramlibacter sp.]
MNETLYESPSQDIDESFTDAQWQVRVDLAAAYRMAWHFGWTDLIYNHITAKVPGAKDRFLINPLGLMYDEVTASNLVEIDFEGNIRSNTRHRVNHAGFVIHSAIHRARPDASCVLHTHSRAGVAVSCLRDGFKPMTQGGLQFDGRIGYHDYEGFNVRLDEQQRLVKSIGRDHALILRNHGLLTVGNCVAKAVQRMHYLEQACQVMVDALSTGQPTVELADPVRAATSERWYEGSSDASANDDIEWLALRRMMDRLYPGYAT